MPTRGIGTPGVSYVQAGTTAGPAATTTDIVTDSSIKWKGRFGESAKRGRGDGLLGQPDGEGRPLRRFCVWNCLSKIRFSSIKWRKNATYVLGWLSKTTRPPLKPNMISPFGRFVLQKTYLDVPFTQENPQWPP